MKILNDNPDSYAQIEAALSAGLIVERCSINERGQAVEWRPVNAVDRAWHPSRYRIGVSETTNLKNDCDQIAHELAEAFIAWPLPESVCADLCATRQGPGRIGTSLLSYIEARQMMRDVVLPKVLPLVAENAFLHDLLSAFEWQRISAMSRAEVEKELLDAGYTKERIDAAVDKCMAMVSAAKLKQMAT